MTVFKEYWLLLWSVSPPNEAVECDGIVTVALCGSLTVCKIEMWQEYQELCIISIVLVSVYD